MTRRWAIMIGGGAAALAFAAMGVTPALASTTGTCSEAGSSTVTVTCTAGNGTWTPPVGLTTASFTLDGAAGGSAGSDPGGQGGQTAAATVAVSSSTTYQIAAGTKGQDGASGPGVGGAFG